MNNEELIGYYRNLLIIQYRGKPRAGKTIEAFIRLMIIFELISQVKNGFDIDTAQGSQLDILAKYAGVRRQITGVDFSRRFFGFITYAEPDPPYKWTGYISYENSSAGSSKYFSYDENQAELLVLSDSELRLFIWMGIFRNSKNTSLKEIDSFLEEYLPSVTAEEIGLMRLRYIVPNDLDYLFPIIQSEGLLPRSAGEYADFAFF